MDVYYYDDYDKDEVRDSIYEGLVAGLGDKYLVYYDEEAFNEFQVSTTGDYYGRSWTFTNADNGGYHQ